MATPYHLPVPATQVGTYFAGQYYQVLQQQPDLVHQFYSDKSTMIRIDGTVRETAAAMLQIHTLVMSLNYVGVEIKTVHSLDSWNGGVLVMITGSVLMNNFSDPRKFVQTFFLAPQEKGYFVLNDIFHFIEEEAIRYHPMTYLGQNNLDPKVNASAIIQGPVSSYIPGGETQPREFVAPADIKENGLGDNYSFADQQLQQTAEAEKIVESHFAQSNGPLHDSMNSKSEHVAAPIENINVEAPKHTYASILQVSKGQPATTTPPRSSSNKPTPPASEWDYVPDLPPQQSLPSLTALEESETTKDLAGEEEEVEVKSVYVRNLLPTVSASELEEVFKKFGELKPDAVAIRNRKDQGACYAFVEFEDISGVQNAIQASTVEIGGQHVFIEGRRANRFSAFRGGRSGRVRGRGGYYIEASRGRFGYRSYGRGNGQEGDRDYNRPRPNGFHRTASRQDRGRFGNRVPRSVQNQSE